MLAARRGPRHGFGLLCLGLLLAGPACAYGPEGHRIAGELAEPLLCRPAAAQVAALGKGQSLAELGLWADEIRDRKAWRHTGPWHYMNLPDGASVAGYRHPPEGDVLWAIEHFSMRLAAARSASDRLEALRFVVHFVVNVHQPLHVGRAADRGGNDVDVRYRDKTVNLHRFWDTDVLRLAGLSETRYEAALRPLVADLAVHSGDSPPETWAAESLALRPWVYDFRRQGREPARLDAAYLDRAEAVTRLRLAQAAVRLAATLNRLLGC